MDVRGSADGGAFHRVRSPGGSERVQGFVSLARASGAGDVPGSVRGLWPALRASWVDAVQLRRSGSGRAGTVARGRAGAGDSVLAPGRRALEDPQLRCAAAEDRAQGGG